MGVEVRIPLGEGRGGAISGYLAEPVGATGAALVVVQEIFGVNGHVRSVVDRFAERGFRVLAPALFDVVEAGVELGYDAAGVERGRELAQALGFDAAVDAVAAAAAFLDAPGATGVVGFCWGGTVAFLGCTRLGLPAVSYYGSRSVPFLGEPARAPMVFHFGERDHLITPAHVAEHRRLQPQAQLYVYPAGHGFNCDRRGDFEPESAALAWQRTLEFFARHLQAGVR